MRVLQINSVCGVGSTGRIATDIDKILKNEGNESYIAFGRGNAKFSDTTIKIGSKLDNYIHVAQTRFFDKHGFASKKATKDFINKVKELDPDVIHLHNIHGYYLNIEILFDYLKETEKPVVWTLHDCWPFTGHCSYFDYVSCDKWITECHSCPQTKSYPSSLIADNSKQNYYKKKELFNGVKHLTIVTPSNWLAEIVKKSFLGRYPVEVINNGIDLEVFKPTESDFRGKLNIKDKFIILGVAGAWEKRKGYEYFYGLSKELKEDEVIVMVGLTEQQTKELPDNVIGITKTDSVKELAEIYSAADVFVNPTLEDNFPTTNLEALACGTPVITFNTGGSIESINESCGIISEEKNVGDLFINIRKVKENGKNKYSCRSHAKEHFNKEDKFQKYLELYKKII
ncbi:Glycosyltransferase involved in cell wall bisynthesis [Mesobacillus persicus]|uniref:Glycosyltransferase involved in cell wall bisynthesis n=1 Tax=Mesobacillus persicus TaxID=930146 RepID=A0A1H8GXS0_9BACI|nr:glycosyltransferase [Mesobacillus persicus]SEN48756.1 Glycosyltransferase involved in cell wall bisynthesis [Mesobacillus persicus]